MIDPADLRDVFDRAASLPPVDRAAFLEHACRDNVVLRQEVERLLAADARLGPVFDRSAGRSDDGGSAGADERLRTLAPGTHLGPYVVDAMVGAGGMGEVYRAHDTRLGRTVAIKVLPSALTQDSGARQRFEREARAVAALSHPHICPLFDIGREGDRDYLVMEFLSGATLSTRLLRDRLPLDEALTCGIDIADALAAAHRAAIIHRDLKPGNIMLTASGVKLLDFGLARYEAAESASLATQEPLTRSGTILGTVQYMAPEQLEGRPTDARTDIFAFGLVLYETVTGRRAFEGSTQAAIIGNILRAEPPPLSSSARNAPPALDRLIRKCLAKDPGDRWTSMNDVRDRLAALRDVLHDGSGRVDVPARRRILTRAGLVMAALLVAAVAAGWWTLRRQPAAPASESHALAPAQRNLTRLTFDEGLQTDPTFSPDGRFVAYASDRNGNFDIWVQPLSGGDSIQVTKSPAHDTEPTWSPDGSTIAFRSERDGGGIYLVSAFGGPERLLVKRGDHPSWSAAGSEVRFFPDSWLFTASIPGLQAIPVEGGQPHELLSEFSKEGGWLWIAPRPDGGVSFLGSHRTLGSGFFTVAPDGHVTASRISNLPPPLAGFPNFSQETRYDHRFEWNRQGTTLVLETSTNDLVRNLWKVRVDQATLEWTSIERLTTNGAGQDVKAVFAPDGDRIAFSTQRESQRVWRFPVNDAHDRLLDGRPLTEDGLIARNASVSPDGKKVISDLRRPGAAGPSAMWITDASGHSERLGTVAGGAIWSPDQQQIGYFKYSYDAKHSPNGVAMAVQHIGSGAEHLLTNFDPYWAPWGWVRDGSALLVSSSVRQLDVLPIPASGLSQPRAVIKAPETTNLFQASFSPNSRWLLFLAISATEKQLGVTTAEGHVDRNWTVIEGNHIWVDKPRWASDGKRIYFLAADPTFLNLYAIDFDPDRGSTKGKAVVISHFDSPGFRVSPRVIGGTSLDVTTHDAFLTMLSTSGNICVLDNVK